MELASGAEFGLESFSPEPGYGFVTLTVDHGERRLPQLLRELDGVATATLRQPTLDDVFLALTGRGGGGGAGPVLHRRHRGRDR